MDQFLQQIFVVIHQIPVGRVSTYGAIAKMAYYPGYARHVGKALGHLPEGVSYLGFESSTAKAKFHYKGKILAPAAIIVSRRDRGE